MKQLLTLVCGICLTVTLTFAQDTQPAQGEMTKKTKKSEKAALPTTDPDIQKCIQDRLANAPKLKSETITVAVTNGEATLSGNVKAGKGSVTTMAKSCGAKKVTNNIVQESTAKSKKSDEKKTGSTNQN
jgi:osmotically-inducible protein OsmY